MTTTEHFPVLAQPRERGETAPLGLFISVFIIASVVYSALSTGSFGGCLGGITGDGGFIDNAGNPTNTEPSCIMMQLHPQAFVYLILAAVALISMTIIRRRQARGLTTKTLTAAGALVIVVVAAAFTVYHLMWVQALLVGDWRNTHDLVVPFLSNVTIDRTSWY
jgi:glucan phosphoethanolaminetransferase (alkaline phosphatase superfamily)